MSYWSRHKSDPLLASLLSIVFLWQLTLLPQASHDNFTNDDHNYYTSFKQYEEAYIINEFTGNELLNYIEINHILGRNIRDFQRIFYRNMEAVLLPVISLGIALFYTLTCSRRLKQRISILSTSLGGHAPPDMVF
jgi:hypothetical protein